MGAGGAKFGYGRSSPGGRLGYLSEGSDAALAVTRSLQKAQECRGRMITSYLKRLVVSPLA